MKLINERQLKLNQLKIILEDNEGNFIGKFYPHLKDKSLNRIMCGRKLGKIKIEGTITSKNIDEISNWFAYLRTFCKDYKIDYGGW